MRQTLFMIDHAFFDDYWLLIAWLLVGTFYAIYQSTKGKTSEVFQTLPFFAVGAAIIYFVLPNLQTLGVNVNDPDGPLVAEGLAIRGYGVFLLFAMLAGFSVVLYRCHQIGFDIDKIMSLMFWMVVAGLIGARIFYVVQKFDSFSDLTLQKMILKFVDMTAGGLVVYGSLIGGVLAAGIYTYIYKLPWRTIGDILAPGMLIGLAIGRMGCLMNGCCYGGVCDVSEPGIYFPPASPPYVQQLSSGELLGLKGDFDTDDLTTTVTSINEFSGLEERGIQIGDRVRVYLAHEIQNDDMLLRLAAAKSGIANKVFAVVEIENKPPVVISAKNLPNYSLKTHPTQIYSSINALLLCVFLWFYFPFRKNPGEVMAIMLMLYPISRFMLEMIRNDEAGQLGTSLTISQWVSFGTFVCGATLFIFARTSRS